MLKEQLDNINKYLPDNIEIVISDDCSDDNIGELVASYNNKQFKYFRTTCNLGHDLNILHAIEVCEAKYVMVLRTRDNIYMPNIAKMTKLIKQYSKAGFYYFSAIDERGKNRLSFNNGIYKKGVKSALAHFALPEHPSGNIYNKYYLNIPLYRQYICDYFDNIYAFCVHEMIRCDLSMKADIVTSNIIGWIYTDTLKSKDIAVNSSKTGLSVYAPEYCYPRYRCLFEFAKNNISKDIRIKYLTDIVHKQYIFTIGRAKTICNDDRYNSHYAGYKCDIKRHDVAMCMDEITQNLIKNLEEEEKFEIMKVTNKDKKYLFYIYPIKEKIRNILINTPIASIYKRIIGKIPR